LCASSQLPTDDIRSKPPAWLRYFKEGGSASQEWLSTLDGINQILTSKGRTLAQGALAWIWARSGCAIPIPGVRTVQQVEENVGAVEFGPLTSDQMVEISRLLGR
jgi:aryl-alcohol dehydrogenase-like predicted oxidoreductase